MVDDDVLEGYTGRTREELTSHLDRPQDMVNLLAEELTDALPDDFLAAVTNVRLYADTILVSVTDRQLRHVRYTERMEQPDAAFSQMKFTERPDGHPDAFEHREYRTPAQHTFDTCTDCGGDPLSDCPACAATGTTGCERCDGGLLPCGGCEGTATVRCPTCRGEETLECETCEGEGHLSRTVPCETCESSGSITRHESCTNCQGNGSFTDAEGETTRCGNCRGGGTVSVTRTCPSCNGAGGQTIRNRCPDCQLGHNPCPECEGQGDVPCSACEQTGTRECPTCEGGDAVPCEECEGDGELTCETCVGDGETHQYVLVHNDYIVDTEEYQIGSLPHGIEEAEWVEFDARLLEPEDRTVRREASPRVAAIREVRYDYGDQTFNLRQMGDDLYYTRYPEPVRRGLLGRLRDRFTG